MAEHAHEVSDSTATVLRVIPLAAPTPAPLPTVTVTVMPGDLPPPVQTIVVAGLGQRDTFDWITALVVPIALGLVTVLVSVVSLRIARLAQKTASDANELTRVRTEDERRQWRYNQLPALQAWYLGQVRLEDQELTGEESIRQVEVEERLKAALAARADDAGVTLLEWLKWWADPTRPDANPNRVTIVDEGYWSMNSWARDPSEMSENVIWPHCM